MPMYREELDEARCGGKHPEGHPDCDHNELYAHPACHRDSPTWFVYADGVGTVICAECENPVVKIAIASKESH